MASVRVEVREGRGRCLVAVKRFGLGDVIVSQRPYEAVLNDEQVETKCHYTFAEAEKLKRCAGCKFARYSSSAAQKAAWPAHKPECKALQSGRQVSAPVRLAARIMWKRAREEAGGRSGDSYADVEGLQTHWDNFSAELKCSVHSRVPSRGYGQGTGPDYIIARRVSGAGFQRVRLRSYGLRETKVPIMRAEGSYYMSPSYIPDPRDPAKEPRRFQKRPLPVDL